MAAGKASAKGAAHDPTVITVDNTPEALQAALSAAQAVASRNFYTNQVERMERKVDRAADELEQAEDALAAAKDELEAKQAEWAAEDKEGTNGLG